MAVCVEYGMGWFWIGLLVVCVSATLTDAECHCNTEAACAVFPSNPCSQVGDPDRCQEGWFGSYCQRQNIALRRRCNQSSVLDDRSDLYQAALGVDGKATTNAKSDPRTCAHTKIETNPTWTVNLNTSVPEKIQHTRLYLRDDLQERSNGMEILVGSQMCYNWSSTEHPPPIANVTCRQPLTGTTVTIRIPGPLKFLTLCEVQIFVCSDGWFSEDCDKQCRCLNSTDVCDKITGHCSSGCFPGFHGAKCQTECPDGTFGNNCTSTCGHCLDDVSCNKTTGTCLGGCAAGWVSDDLCMQACPDRSYGNNCSSQCGNCLNEGICEKRDGTCPGGCAAGWMNGTCLQTCVDGKHGTNCDFHCGNCQGDDVCDKETGTCPNGCETWWMGDACKDSFLAGIVGGAVAAVFVVIVVVIIVICRRRKRPKKDDVRMQSALRTSPAAGCKDKPSENESTPRLPPAMDEDDDDMFSVETEVDVSDEASSAYYNWIQPHVTLDKLQQSVNEKKKKASFETEFQSIPYGARHPHEAGKKADNRKKNRFLALYAYDDSRVVLTEGEDYINANYMLGYDDTPKYIATQGPKPGTVTDFWRMVWQEDVTQIVMLTRLMEVNKTKCEHYWPDVNKAKTYGHVKVMNTNVTVRADYKISKFLVKKSGVERTVTHYHFTSWPDHGVPSAPALVNFWRLVKHGDRDRGPMVVHCSAGVGRTGAFISLDYLMDEAESDNRVNVYMCVGKMRQNRMNMVQKAKQYEFVHDVVLEALNSRGTLYTSSEFDKTFGVDGTFTTKQENILKKQFKLLQVQTSDLTEEETSHALLLENAAKNRNRNILPGNNSRPYLCTQVQSRNDFINAVVLPSALRPSSMIVTQTPLPDTVVDFWRLVYDHDCFTVVCLDDSKDTDDMYPKKNKVLKNGPFNVKQGATTSNKGETFYNERKLILVHDKKGTEHSVTLFSLRSLDMMSNSVSLLELINLVDRIISSEDQAVLIHCHDGASVSGVFCSILNVISRLRLDGDVDIFLTIRELQRVRSQFIQSFDQFKLCYHMVKEYKRSTNIYTNM
ncbi:receptor-type tyrosine-protein phosphatase T-like isoform X4 [Haliotis rubra]|uniref:receptor-type tyrosine-protein phosphatase T-like isoform X4 n=1 Tax=Haliotis rubra TaxID=36100 RepID=UPI001EE556F1|nr:receptor-type tyrosine-protein phosphatase T-like isoform X4 [Haliotis rubra]